MTPRPGLSAAASGFSADAAREQGPASWESERLLTRDEIAELLAVPARWVKEHTANGHIPHVMLGRYPRYRGQAVRAWVEEQEQGGAAWRRHRPRLSAVETGGRK